MQWHVDDVLYDPPQLEVVFTLENTSDCRTMWKLNNALEEVETENNSVILLRAGAVPHCVSSLKNGGARQIIKCVYCQKDAEFLESEMVVQFSSKNMGKQKQPRKKKKR